MKKKNNKKNSFARMMNDILFFININIIFL